MGGKSYSAVEIQDGVAHFTGTCAIVPFLKAPGFITMVTGGWRQPPGIFPDVSSCRALKLVLRSNVHYDGYRVSFGKMTVPGGEHASGYKAPVLKNIPLEEFGEVEIPFSSFSSKWDEATGDVQVPCNAENPQYCPTPEWLHNMQTVSFWGEGVEGEVDLEIQTISAVGCSSSSSSSSSTAATTTTIISDSSSSVMAAQQSMYNNHLPARSSAVHSITSAGFMGFFVGLAACIAVAKIVGTVRREQRRRGEAYQEIRSGVVDDGIGVGIDVIEL